MNIQFPIFQTQRISELRYFVIVIAIIISSCMTVKKPKSCKCIYDVNMDWYSCPCNAQKENELNWNK